MSLKELSAILLIVAGIFLAIVSLFLPPPGEIHESVLYIFAQILIYVGSIFGIESYFTQRTRSKPNSCVPQSLPLKGGGGS